MPAGAVSGWLPYGRALPPRSVSALVTDEIERGNAVVIASHSFAIDNAGARAQPGERINDQREATGKVIAGPAVEPHPLTILAGDDSESSLRPS